jgi:hypothetical protein
MNMDYKKIQEEVDKVAQSYISKKSDKQLLSYEILSQLHKFKYQGVQPMSLVLFNERKFKNCKLTVDQVNEIRSRYKPHILGKYKLAKEYGVSPNLIFKIVNGKSWK